MSVEQFVAAAIGMIVVAVVHLLTPLNLTGYGPDGVDWITLVFSAFWFGGIGFGGGITIYEVMRRRKSPK